MKCLKFVIVLFTLTSLIIAASPLASERMFTRDIKKPVLFRNPGNDTIFFDDLEDTTLDWTFHDISIQDTFWHIDTLMVLEGNYSMWCGTYAEQNWVNPEFGYGDEWAQFLISPLIDLTAVTGSYAFLVMYHFYSLESPTPYEHWDGWDCINVWVSVDSGATWSILQPDTINYPGSQYNMYASYAWYWSSLAGMYDSIPGWGGTNNTYAEQGFDLTPYIGQVVQLRFGGASDPLESDESGGPYYGMWYIDPMAVVDELSNFYFYEDWESGMGSWVATVRDSGGVWWHLSTADAYSDSHALYNGDSLSGEMQPAVNSAVISPPIDLTFVSTTDSCVFDCWVKFDFWNIDDGYQIEVSSDGGQTWTNIYYPMTGNNYTFSGSTDTLWWSHNELWDQAAAVPPMLLDPWVGEIINIRISSFSHITDTIGNGLYLDDISVIGSFIDFPQPKHILIFDDDIDAQDIWGYGWEKYYESAISNLGYSFLSIDDENPGLPDSLYMRQNGMVIWHLGPKGDRYGEEAIINRAVENLEGYLRLGGKLLLVGQDYLYNNYPNSFADSVMEITGYNEAVGCDTVIGVSGDSIGDGLYYPLDFGHLNGNSMGIDYVDDIVTTATPVLLANNTSEPIMLRKAQDDYRLVFATFPIEAILAPMMRDTMVNRIINWIDPCPPAPQLTMAVSMPTGVELFWLQNPPRDLAGYNVYRSNSPQGPFSLVGSTVAPDTSFIDTTVMMDSTYYFGTTALDSSSQESGLSEIISITYQYGVNENTIVAIQPILRVYPNPFRDATHLKIQIPGTKSQHSKGHDAEQIALKIYDITGRVVKQWDNETIRRSDQITWTGDDNLGRKVPAGIYFIQLSSWGYQVTRKTILLK